MSENVDTLMRDLEQELGVRGPAAVLRAALKIAKEAAAEARQSQPPAPPAWMVAVAMEVSNDWVAEPVSDACIRALRLALERGHVVVPRPMPSEEEMRAGAREDAAKIWEEIGYPAQANECRMTGDENCQFFRGAFQGRRNTLSEIRAVAPAAVPEVDVEAIAGRAWDAGVHASEMLILSMRKGGLQDRGEAVRSTDVAAILSTLPTREA